MISGYQIPWSAIAIFEMSKTSWQTGNLKWTKIWRRIHQFGKKILPEIFLSCAWSRWHLEMRHSGCWYWRIRKVGCIRNLSQKTECNRSPDHPQRRRLSISCGRWFSNIIRERLRIPRTHSETGTNRKGREKLSGESQGDREEFQPEETKDHAKLRNTSVLFKEISFIVIILNWEFNYTCRKKNHSPFHWNALMSTGQLIPTWK